MCQDNRAMYQDAIPETSDDLCHGCRMSEYSHYRDEEWKMKYMDMHRSAIDNGIRSVAFPSVSTGVYSYPLEEAAEIAAAAVNEFIEGHPGELDLVEWVLFDQNTYKAYEKALGQLTVSKNVHSSGLDESSRAHGDELA